MEDNEENIHFDTETYRDGDFLGFSFRRYVLRTIPLRVHIN